MTELEVRSIDLTGDSDDDTTTATHHTTTPNARRTSPSHRARISSPTSSSKLGPPRSTHITMDPSSSLPSASSTLPSPARPAHLPASPHSHSTSRPPNGDFQVTGTKITSPSISRAMTGGPSSLPGNGASLDPSADMTMGALAMPVSAHVNGSGSNGVVVKAEGSQTNGTTADSAIDLTNIRLPTPPPTTNNKRPVCIGAVQSRAITLYPSEAAIVNSQPAQGVREKYNVVDYNGAQLLKVKLKLRQPGARPKPGETWQSPVIPVIHVMTPGLTAYIGDLDHGLASSLIPHVARGILRLEGFVQRLLPGAPQIQLNIDVLLFTLPSNIPFLAHSMLTSGVFLLDPMPPYDPSRHAEQPEYHNAHGGHANALRMMQAARDRQMGWAAARQLPDKTKQVEVQREQVDKVFKSLEQGGDLEQCDPGPFIKTDLFPHQRKALAFLLHREQDSYSFKKARKAFLKREARLRRKKKDDTEPEVDAQAEEEKTKEKDHDKSLWEGKPDDKGRIRHWKNKITDEDYSSRKGERPNETKGAILADDMGLGKTLSVVSLIASTRSNAATWGRSESADRTPDVEPDPEKSNGLSAADMKTKVFGMPDVGSDEEKPSTKKKGKKRKEAPPVKSPYALTKTKATLLVCPMSTITNWEDQVKEHWNGKVEIVGGSAGVMPPKDHVKKWKPPKKNDDDSSDDDEEFDLLRIYIYHGSARKADPEYIKGFDIVITSYNTLAMEYARQNQGLGDDTPTTPGETTANSDDDATPASGQNVKPDVKADIKPSEVAEALLKKKKGKAAAKPEFSALQALDWFRIVLDEAHYIKSATTVASRAACALGADRRIALTGTPIQNKIEDVWALFKFLRLAPVQEKEEFQKYIGTPCKYGEQIGVARLQLVMRCCTLRRTKESTAEDGRRILNLPTRKEIIMWMDLRDDERQVYDERDQKAKEVYKDMTKAKGSHGNGPSYANVLHEILILRQLCDHIDLAQSGLVEEDFEGTLMDYETAVKGIEANGLNQARALSVVAYLKDTDGAVCQGCGQDYGEYYPSFDLGADELDQKPDIDKKGKKLASKPILTKCQHLWCVKCFKHTIYADWSKRMKESPARACQCAEILKLPQDVIECVPPGEEKEKEADAAPKRVRKKYVRKHGEDINLSTKMTALCAALMKASQRNPNSVNHNPFEMGDGPEEVDAEGKPLITKSVVFSQWTTMLDRIGDMLSECNIAFCRLDGTMSRDERAQAMEDLRTKKKVEVMLVSLRAGGVGLNLTAASRCYLVDPYWNPSVEAQAIDRIHRMGQTRPVEAIRFMIRNSVEEKMLKIQEKKQELARFSLQKMSRKELMEKKAEELAILFS